MRRLLDADRVRKLMQELGRAAKGPGRIYLTGGTSAVLEGWRESTVDADLKLDPEPPGVFDAIRRVKDELDVNVELASPESFIPPLPGWRERSRFIERHGQVDFFHYDFCAQALSKIQRGHDRDLADAREMTRRGLVDQALLRQLFVDVEGDFLRYPAIDVDVLRRKLEAFSSEDDG